MFGFFLVTIGSLSTRVFETRTATGREYFTCQDSGVSQIFVLIISNGEKILSNVNVVVWKQVKRENSSLPVAVSKTCVLKLPNNTCNTRARLVIQPFKHRVKDMFFVVSMLWQDHFLPLVFRAKRNLNFQIVNTASPALSQELGWRVSFRTRCGKISWLIQCQCENEFQKGKKKTWILTLKRLDAGVKRLNQFMRKIVDWRFDKLNGNHAWFFWFVCGNLWKLFITGYGTKRSCVHRHVSTPTAKPKGFALKTGNAGNKVQKKITLGFQRTAKLCWVLFLRAVWLLEGD